MTFERYGAGPFRRWGQGARISSLPEEVVPTWEDFSGGYDASAGNKGAPNTTPFALDVAVTKDNALKPVPGVSLVESLGARRPGQMIVHASLDNAAELLLFAPPELGVKRDAATVWSDEGLVETPGAAWTNFGGTFIWADGESKVYARQAAAATIEEIVEAPIARTYATFAGRIFAFGTEIDGQWEPIGARWSAANSDYRDWTGFGSGAELLIHEMISGDTFVSAHPMGFDLMALAFRRSLWVARYTGLAERPADFQPRVSGVGFVSGRTVQLTGVGVIGLSDDGVLVFDGNDHQFISGKIDKHLLPLDYTQLDRYSSAFDPIKGYYYLLTPTETWVFDTRLGRWHRRSIVALDVERFATQSPILTWADMTQTWAEIEETWRETAPEQSDSAWLYVLAESASDTLLGREDEAEETNLGAPLEPLWQLSAQGDNRGQLLWRFHDGVVDYTGEGEIDLMLPNDEGTYVSFGRFTLPYQEIGDYVRTFMLVTGRGAGLRLRWNSGKAAVSRVELRMTPAGRRLNNVV